MLTREILYGYLDMKANKEHAEDQVREFYESCVQSPVITHSSRNPQITDTTALLAESGEEKHLKLAYAQRVLAEAFNIIVNSIENLRPDRRSVIYFKYIKGMGGKDMADALGVKEPRIWQLHREAINILFKKKRE